jgi:hypothetical protein
MRTPQPGHFAESAMASDTRRLHVAILFPFVPALPKREGVGVTKLPFQNKVFWISLLLRGWGG